jgi:site-specific recombinase XerD
VILGRGPARTDEEIVAEYRCFLGETSRSTSREVLQGLRHAPEIVCRQIGKPIAAWRDQDVIAFYDGQSRSSRYRCSAFIAFLLYWGYLQAGFDLLFALRHLVSRHHARALDPYRRKIVAAQEALQYPSPEKTGSELVSLIWLLAIVHKPLTELTRADYDAFAEQYQARYRREQSTRGQPDTRLTRIEYYLVYWGIIPHRRRVFRYEEYFAQLRHEPIRAAIQAYFAWCDVRYRPSTLDLARAGVLSFFAWLQDRHPQAQRLDDVTRTVALEYASYQKEEGERRRISLGHASQLYARARHFYDFAIREELDTAPARNPFAAGDLPRKPDEVPRYLEDWEVRRVLAYCEHGATLAERTYVLTLLHTGIRVAELTALKASDLVQIQGVWKVHIHSGKGLKDRLIPLTPQCLAALQRWQQEGWEQIGDHLFTHHGRSYADGNHIARAIRAMGRRLEIAHLTAHRFRHTFAVALLNYGMRESALQKLMGHATLNMTLEYARILDRTVEHAFTEAIDQMREGAHSWVPSFFKQEDYTLFAEAAAAIDTEEGRPRLDDPPVWWNLRQSIRRWRPRQLRH